VLATHEAAQRLHCRLTLGAQGLVPNAFEAQIKAETSVFSRLFGRKKDVPAAADVASPKAASGATKGKFFSM
jgi:hypothetical protein